MYSVFIKVHQNNYKYAQITVIQSGLLYESVAKFHKHQTWLLNICGVWLHYLIKKLECSHTYREGFLNHMEQIGVNRIKFMLFSAPSIDTIDYNWNQKLCYMVRERCELDHTLSWLSTLGGAFSALGDYFVNMAETAGKISFHQLQLGIRLGDPNVAARCKLYFSLSLIQRCHFKMARNIIYHEYCNANKMNVRDERLIRMCQGIWAKLQYEYKMYKLNKVY